MRYTPENITELKENEIFVFGSNAEGAHFGGAARVAKEKFGAVLGMGEGLQGQSYAVPTMEGLGNLQDAVWRFIFFATHNPQLTFLVTKLGTGIAGYKIEQIAPLFRNTPINVILPKEFADFNS